MAWEAMHATDSAKRAPWACPSCGADFEGACDPLGANCGGVCPELVIARLERAGATLLAMRDRSPYPPAIRSAMPEVVHAWIESYGWQAERPRAAIPGALEISRMDRAYLCLQLIPSHRRVLRRIVAARSLVSPMTDRHVFSWRGLARVIGADHHAVMRWHREGIAAIVEGLQVQPVRKGA